MATWRLSRGILPRRCTRPCGTANRPSSTSKSIPTRCSAFAETPCKNATRAGSRNFFGFALLSPLSRLCQRGNRVVGMARFRAQPFTPALSQGEGRPLSWAPSAHAVAGRGCERLRDHGKVFEREAPGSLREYPHHLCQRSHL